MTVLCIHYVFIITIFDLMNLGVLNTLAVSSTGIFIMFMLCNSFVNYEHYERIMDIHNA